MWYAEIVKMDVPKPLQLAVFDLDGTLVQLEHDHFAQQIEVTLSKMRLHVPPRPEILALINGHRLAALFTGPSQRELFWSHYEEGDPPPPRVFERSIEALDGAVARGLAVSVATARKVHHEELAKRLRSTGLLRHIELISTFHNTGWLDKVEQLRQVCKSHAVEPRRAMMVGDTEDDMQSSLLVGYGLRVAMKTGLTSAERLRAHKPHRVLGCIGEVPLVIDEYHRKGGETAAPLAPIGEDEA